MLFPFTFFLFPLPYPLYITLPSQVLSHNISVSQLSLQKQALDKELDTHKEKLKWTEGQLKESQKKETQTQAQLTVTPCRPHQPLAYTHSHAVLRRGVASQGLCALTI